MAEKETNTLPMGEGTYSYEVDKEMVVRTVSDYYWCFRRGAYAMARAGNYPVASHEKPDTEVIMAPGCLFGLRRLLRPLPPLDHGGPDRPRTAAF